MGAIALVSAPDEVQNDLLLHDLVTDESLRGSGLNGAHVEALAEVSGGWEPVLIWGPNNLVLDGAHRVAAARKLGMRTIRVQRFLGDEADAFVESVRRNVKHGLPLSLNDRVRAATRVTAENPDWSDRRIAKVCGVSPATVSRVRADLPSSGDEGSGRRIGLDGKARPARAGMARDRVLAALEKNPDSSLRAIAAVANVSPETVRTVRKSLQGEPQTSEPFTIVPYLRSSPAPSPVCANDRALSSCDAGDRLVEWFDGGRSIDEWPQFVAAIPMSRLYELADECYRRASEWSRFGRALEARTQRRRSLGATGTDS